MSIGSCIGASAASKEMIKYIEALVAQPDFKDKSPHEVADIVLAKAREILETANAGWY